MNFIKKLFQPSSNLNFATQVQNVLGIKPGNFFLYQTALSHRSVKEGADENNERLEYLGDAVLGAVVARVVALANDPGVSTRGAL